MKKIILLIGIVMILLSSSAISYGGGVTYCFLDIPNNLTQLEKNIYFLERQCSIRYNYGKVTYHEKALGRIYPTHYY